MVQQFIVPALTALFTSSATLAVFYFREYSLLKKRVQELVEEAPAAKAATPEQIAEITKQLEIFRSRMDEMEKRRKVAFDTGSAPMTMSAAVSASPNRRSQILRLHRSGESIASIASALGISQGEVKLMVKVQELLADNGSVERPSDFL
jgi:DNA-binding NarL/FixJ family response regulator